MPDFNPWISYVNSLCTQMSQSLGLTGINRSTFVWVVDTFSLVLNLFNDNLIRVVNGARLIGDQKIVPKSLREDYNTYRHTYIRFLDDYTTFVGDLNKRFRTRELNYGGGLGSTTQTAFRSMYAERPKEL